MERVFEVLRERLAIQIFDSVEDLQAALTAGLKKFWKNPRVLVSLTTNQLSLVAKGSRRTAYTLLPGESSSIFQRSLPLLASSAAGSARTISIIIHNGITTFLDGKRLYF
jgi:hypothetical protein